MIYNDQIIVSDGYLMTPNLSIYYTYIEPVPKYTDLPCAQPGGPRMPSRWLACLGSKHGSFANG